MKAVTTIEGVQVTYPDVPSVPPEELNAYVLRGLEKYGDRLVAIDLAFHSDSVDINYSLKPRPFHRLRRITGYLVGSLDRFNNAKRAEESERVKHSTMGS